MSEEKKNVETEVVKEEARELTEKELAQVSGGWGRQGPAAVPQSVIYNQIAGEYGNVKR